MHHDDKHLADITDKTMRRLINETVVMPSKYMETFTEEEQKILRGTPGQSTEEGTVNEIDLLRSQLFSDDITRAKNRLWLYQQKLNERQGFVDEGYLVSLRIPDYETIVSEYDSIVGNRVLTLVYNYVTDYMTKHHVPFEIVRYAAGHFLLFLHGMEEAEVEEHLVNMQNGAANHTFKHRSRIFGITFNAAAIRYIRNEPFASVMDQLEEKKFEKEVVKGGTTGRT
jgi:hypothetical protein